MATAGVDVGRGWTDLGAEGALNLAADGRYRIEAQSDDPSAVLLVHRAAADAELAADADAETWYPRSRSERRDPAGDAAEHAVRAGETLWARSTGGAIRVVASLLAAG